LRRRSLAYPEETWAVKNSLTFLRIEKCVEFHNLRCSYLTRTIGSVLYRNLK
jgi:hypothetical protein